MPMIPHSCLIARISASIGWIVAAYMFSGALSVQAACGFVGTTASTYHYTAATIDNAAELVFDGVWQCYDSGVEHYDHWGCYRATFAGNIQESLSGDALDYIVDIRNLGASLDYLNVGSGIWYNNAGPPHAIGEFRPVPTSLVVTIPAGHASGKSAGSYSNTDIRLAIDLQDDPNTCKGMSGGVGAGETSYTANVVIPNICQVVSSSTVDFGSVPIGAATSHYDATGSITVKCTGNTDYTVYLDPGHNSDGGQRRMSNGSAYLPYQLYKDAARLQIWDNTGGPNEISGSGGVNGLGNNAEQNLFVYGRIPVGTVVPAEPGAYRDTVIVTVAY